MLNKKGESRVNTEVYNKEKRKMTEVVEKNTNRYLTVL